jgi:hypothetical protein
MSSNILLEQNGVAPGAQGENLARNRRLCLSRFVSPAASARIGGSLYAELAKADAPLHRELIEYIEARGANLVAKAESELLIAAAPHLSRFVARLFDVEKSVSPK